MAFLRHTGWRQSPFGRICRAQCRNFSQPNPFFSCDDSVIPVLIVGAGPVGLCLSALLTKLGVRCSILERGTSFTNHPQAHFINNRSMEIFRDMDGLAEEIVKLQPPIDLWRKFIYCTTLTGQILGSVDHMQDCDESISPVSVAHFSQYKLIRLLLKQLEDLNFLHHQHFPNTEKLLGRELLLGHECVSITANGTYVDVKSACKINQRHEERNFKCSILVGTDGASSTVRNLVGVPMSGHKDLQKLVSVHFFSRDLGQYLLSERPGMLYFVYNTEAVGVFVAHDLEKGEFILQIPYYPPQQTLDDFTPSMCKQLIKKLVGREVEDTDVKAVKSWVMHALVAEKFSLFGNRIILAGDAAHQFPPAGGFGMNTGIQDAHNLAWKIASVARGIASSEILQTYEIERKPIAVFNSALSVSNFKAAMAVPAALGLDVNLANFVHDAVRVGVGSILPLGMQKSLMEGIFKLGRSQLSRSFLNKNNPLGSSRLSKLERILTGGKSLQLQFPAEDLGFRYRKGALIEGKESPTTPPEFSSGYRKPFVACAETGSRLPHANLMLLPKREVVSSLDLVSYKDVGFALMIRPEKSSYELGRAALQVAEDMKLSLKISVIWSDECAYDEELSAMVFGQMKRYDDASEVREPGQTVTWSDTCRMGDKGAVLVRPDGHVAWRLFDSSLLSDHSAKIREVFSRILRTM